VARALRRTVVTLLVVFLLAAAADLGARLLAQNVIASRLRQAGQLSADPAVTVVGFPFLPQALRGRLDEVDVTSEPPPATGADLPRLGPLQARLRGVSAPTAALLSGGGQVRVSAATLSTTLDYADLARALTARVPALNGVSVTGSPDGVATMQATIKAYGAELPVSVPARVVLAKGRLVFSVPESAVAAQAPDLPAAIRHQLAQLLVISVAVPRLPYGLTVSRVNVTPQGLAVTATGSDLALAVG
jgi:LmeA-like phospholipid-binding